MCDLYDRIEQLCKNSGISVTRMCKEAGIPRANLTELKQGRQQTLGMATIAKISEYFRVSMDFLTGGKTEKAPGSEEPRAAEDDLKFAMFDGEEVSDETWEKVKAFARFAAEEEKKQKEDCGIDDNGRAV